MNVMKRREKIIWKVNVYFIVCRLSKAEWKRQKPWIFDEMSKVNIFTCFLPRKVGLIPKFAEDSSREIETVAFICVLE